MPKRIYKNGQTIAKGNAKDLTVRIIHFVYALGGPRTIHITMTESQYQEVMKHLEENGMEKYVTISAEVENPGQDEILYAVTKTF